MFSFREFLMTGFENAIGKLPDYKVILNASGYFEKGVLTEEDLAKLQGMIEEKNASDEVDFAEEADEQY